MEDFNQQSKYNTACDVPQQLLSEECSNPTCRMRIRELEQQLQRVKSVGYDMLKQRGAWQISGQKPSNSSLDFNDLFDHEVEDVVRGLRKDGKLGGDEARVLVCREFQKMYEKCKELIFKKLVDTLYKVFLIGSDDDSDEQLFDVCRAYGLLLNASGVLQTPVHEELAQEANSKLKSTFETVPVPDTQTFTKKAAKLSWDLLTTIPPLVSAEPRSNFYREWHEKELPPTWNKDLADYELVYYRPILFMSCEGKATRKGWVGNREISSTQSSTLSTTDMMSTDVLHTSTSDSKHVNQTSKLPDTLHTSQHSCKPRGTNPKSPRHSGSSPSKTRFDIDTANTKEHLPRTHGALQEGFDSQDSLQQESPVRSQYYPQRAYYADKDEESSSQKTATTSSTSGVKDSTVWTGETMWRMRP